MTRRHCLVIALVVVLLIAGACSAWHAILSIHIAFADDQTRVFEEMVDRASAALSTSPPDVTTAIGSLKYLHYHYPSGTKQVVGSRLEQIVERSRHIAEKRIMDMLRVATGDDLGDDPEAWLERYFP